MALHIISPTDYVLLPSNTTINPRNELTVEFWNYYDVGAYLNTNTNGMFQMRNNTDGKAAPAGYIGGSNNLTVRCDTSAVNQAVADSGTVPLRTWTHWAFVYDGANTVAYLYKNGTLAGTLSSAGTALDSGINATWIGSWNDVTGATSYYSDFRIYNAARSASQILSDYNKRLNGNESNLVAYYKLLSDVNDSTSNAYNGTLEGSAAISSTVGEPPFLVPGGFFLAAQ